MIIVKNDDIESPFCSYAVYFAYIFLLLLSQSFREELESLIQEQMKKGNNSSNIWALRQIADFMASTAPSVFPTCPVSKFLYFVYGKGITRSLSSAMIKGRKITFYIGALQILAQFTVYLWSKIGHVWNNFTFIFKALYREMFNWENICLIQASCIC